MVEVMEPQTPEEAAALRALAEKHRRRHRWVALLPSVAVSFFTTAILHVIWHGSSDATKDPGVLKPHSWRTCSFTPAR